MLAHKCQEAKGGEHGITFCENVQNAHIHLYNVQDTHTQFYMDNKPAVAQINQKSCQSSRALLHLTKALLAFCLIRRKIFIAMYLPGKDEIVVERLHRPERLETRRASIQHRFEEAEENFL